MLKGLGKVHPEFTISLEFCRNVEMFDIYLLQMNQ